jgi:zinc protease
MTRGKLMLGLCGVVGFVVAGGLAVAQTAAPKAPAKPQPPKAATAKPAAEAKPTETKPAESKPAATKPADTKPDAPTGSLSGETTAAIVHTVALKQQLEKGITLARLTNGLTVIIQENHAAPVATVRCYVQNTGSAYEGKDLGAGLSHVLEHTVAGGTTSKRTEPQIRGLLDSLGGQTNAYTSDDITCFLIDCPASGVETAIQLTAENMQFSLIPVPEYDRELGVVQRELEMGEVDRSRVMYNQMKQLIYQVHPKRHPTIGYLNVVRQIKREEVLAFYKSRYVPQNMVFVVVGDVSTDSVLEEVLANFKSFQRTPERFEVMPVEPEQASPRQTRLEMEGGTTQLALAWPTVPLQDPDLYPLDVASFILTNGDSSRLVKRLKIDEPLAVAVTSFSNTPGGVKGWFQVTVDCPPANVEKCRAIVFEEIERLKTEPVTEKELAKAKRQKAAEHVFSQQKVENQAEMLSESYRSTGDPLFDSRYVDGIQTVQPEQIQAAAKKYFLPHRLNTVRIDPLGLPTDAAAAEQSAAAETEILKEVLPNGLTLLLKRASAVPLVSIQVYARGGVLADTAETAGAASLTTEMLEQGTEKYTAEQIAEYFDSVGGTLSLSSQSNSSFLQCAVLKGDADTALDYVHQVICKPTFPQAEFDNVKQLRLARIASRSANAQAEIMDFFARQLPAAVPYSRTSLGTAETVSELTVDTIKSTYEKLFVPQNMVIAVFGDIDPAAMKAKLVETFGAMPKGQSAGQFDFPPKNTPFAATEAKHLQTKKKNTGMVLIAYPTVSIRDEKSRASLDVLDALLTGGGAAGGRLHEELRGQQLVYYVFGIQMTGFAPGYFSFLAQTQPKAIPEVVSRIQAALDTIRKDGVPADEFEKAKAKLITAHSMKSTTASERAFQASLDELYGLGYDYEASFARRINAVQIEDVQEIVKTLFVNPLVITTSPEPAAEAAGKE